MTFTEYLKLEPEQQKAFQSQRTCPLCNHHLIRVDGHSTGDLHVACPSCKVCPDCEDGE